MATDPHNITIVIHDPVYNKEFVYDRDQRKGLYATNAVPGGNIESGCQIPCNVIGTKWMPHIGSPYYLKYGGKNGTIFWSGRLAQPHFTVKKRVITGVQLTAEGYVKQLEDRRFDNRLTFGFPETRSWTINDKINVTDISEIIAYAISQKCPDIQVGAPYLDATGIQIHANTQTFQGSTPADIVNFAASLTAYLDNPFLWTITPLIAGLPTLKFQAIEYNPYYYEDGLSEWDAKYDLNNIFNVGIVEWGTDQRWTEPAGDPPDISGPIAYAGQGSGVDIRRDKYVNAAEEYTGFDDIKALASAYATHFNRLIASGTITLNQPIRTRPLSSGAPSRLTPLHLVEAGRACNVALPDNWPEHLSMETRDIDKFVTQVRWNEDAGENECENAQLSFGEVQGLFAEIRRLMTMDRAHMTWSMSFANTAVPIRNTNEAPPLGTLYEGTHYADGVVSTVLPMAALSSGAPSGGGGPQQFGKLGGQLLPGILPDNFSELLVPIRTADGSPIPVDPTVPVLVIPLTKDYFLSEWLTASVQPGRFEIDFKVGPDSTSWTNFLVGVVKQPAGRTATGTFVEKRLTKGDILNVFVVNNAGNIANATVNVSGNKHWPQFPQYPAHPNAVP